jgi:hypothetical protein
MRAERLSCSAVEAVPLVNLSSCSVNLRSPEVAEPP